MVAVGIVALFLLALFVSVMIVGFAMTTVFATEHAWVFFIFAAIAIFGVWYGWWHIVDGYIQVKVG